MRLFGDFPLLLLLAVEATAQITLTGTVLSSTENPTAVPTSSYNNYSSTSTDTNTATAYKTNSTLSVSFTYVAAANSSVTQNCFTSSLSITCLVDGQPPASNRTTHATSTSTSPQPTNTRPCNGHLNFCSRKFSNLTMVAAHNSPFVRPGNAASNQVLDVTTQLNDGVRMLQSESHFHNNSVYLCHTSCDTLNAGTLESYLSTVVSWLSSRPYEALAILLVNSDFVGPSNYVAPVTNSGLLDYLYIPPKVPMSIDDWPTLSTMILSNKRVIMMLDYQANQTAVPWLLDEFGQMWETPFSPTNASFPCTAQRPPAEWAGALPRSNRMYMANHNLNVEIDVAGFKILTPAYGMLDQINSAASTYGALETTRLTCTAMWDRPPNFLLIDYYNYGNFNGSAFQVAANANEVTYNRASCCGTVSSLAQNVRPASVSTIALGLVFVSSLI